MLFSEDSRFNPALINNTPNKKTSAKGNWLAILIEKKSAI